MSIDSIDESEFYEQLILKKEAEEREKRR